MAKKLAGQVAFITGGGRGIGRGIAAAFAREGCHLALIARTKPELDSTASTLQKESDVTIMTFAVDIADENNVRKAVDAVSASFGHIDILVNNAGEIGPIGNLTTVNSAKFFQTLRVNLGGTLFCMQAIVPLMQQHKSGCIINFSGGGALNPFPFFDAYSASKAAVVRLTENLAIELEDSGITVCAIAPGGVNTKMFEDMLAAGEAKVGEKLWQKFQLRAMEGGDSIDRPAELAVFIAANRPPVFNGRVISAQWDNWQAILDHENELRGSDVYQLRRILPKDRGYDW